MRHVAWCRSTLSGHSKERLFYHNVSLQDHAREVCQSAAQFSAPRVLLSHSMGGVTVSAPLEPVRAFLVAITLPGYPAWPEPQHSLMASDKGEIYTAI